MNIFGVGLAEVIVVLVVALLVLGPDRLPQAASALGRTLREARKVWADVSRDVGRDLAQLSDEPPAARDAVGAHRPDPRIPPPEGPDGRAPDPRDDPARGMR